jgi:hypothetical protein
MPNNVVDIVKSIVRIIHSIDFGDVVFAGNDDLSLDLRESFVDNGDGRRLLVLACDGHKGFVLLAYGSVEVFGPSEISDRVSADVQGFLWGWGSRCSDVWGGMWGGRGSLVSWLAMRFVVGCIGELLAHFLKFGGDASDLSFEFADSVCVGGLCREHSLFHAFKAE